MSVSSRPILSFIAIGLLFAALMTTQIMMRPRQVVSFDVDKTVALFIEQLGHKNFDKAQLTTLTHRFSNNLKATLHGYAKTHRVVVIKSQAAIAGVDDITDDIQQALSNIKRGAHANKA